MHMANTTAAESNPGENMEFSSFDDNVDSELSPATLGVTAGVEDVRADNGKGTPTSSQLSGVSEVLNPEEQDSNPGSPDSYPLTNGVTEATTTSRLRKFVSSAKERFDNVEPGWAQRKTTSTEDASGK